MQATQLDIENKHRQDVGFVASLKDFSYTEGADIDPGVVVDNPQVSLYCFDDAARRAILWSYLPRSISRKCLLSTRLNTSRPGG